MKILLSTVTVLIIFMSLNCPAAVYSKAPLRTNDISESSIFTQKENGDNKAPSTESRSHYLSKMREIFQYNNSDIISFKGPEQIFNRYHSRNLIKIALYLGSAGEHELAKRVLDSGKNIPDSHYADILLESVQFNLRNDNVDEAINLTRQIKDKPKAWFASALIANIFSERDDVQRAEKIAAWILDEYQKMHGTSTTSISPIKPPPYTIAVSGMYCAYKRVGNLKETKRLMAIMREPINILVMGSLLSDLISTLDKHGESTDALAILNSYLSRKSNFLNLVNLPEVDIRYPTWSRDKRITMEKFILKHNSISFIVSGFDECVNADKKNVSPKCFDNRCQIHTVCRNPSHRLHLLQRAWKYAAS